MKGRKKGPAELSALRLQDEILKISRDFMPEIPGMLNRLKRDDPAKAIQAWVNITEFIHAKRGKDTSALPNMNIQINMIPASQQSQTEDVKYIEVEQKKIDKSQD
jgi:hypothetical protein